MTEPDWTGLATRYPQPLVDELHRAYDRDSVEFTAQSLADAASTSEHPWTENEALALLEGAGDWLQKESRPGEIDPEYPDEPPPTVTVYVWQGASRRRTAWLLLVHGMNTTGFWQENLAFDLGLWQGQVVPTFVFKYGVVRVGVALPWRRATLKKKLRERILTLSQDAPEFHVDPAPDVVAHSFGTWLIGHVLLDELARPSPELRLGRLVLTGSILRPDFPWAELQRAGLVQDVLNHYGTKDSVVPLAHWTIADSGPSGRRGFDVPEQSGGGFQVVNVAAPDFRHSQALSDRERFNGYAETWKPFLTNPVGQAGRRLPTDDPTSRWTQAWWPLRGTLLPAIAGPLLLAMALWALLLLGEPFSRLEDRLRGVLVTTTVGLWIAGAGLAVLFALDRLRSYLRAQSSGL